jgi:ABC-type Fe3+/spermidine/putrescine transport system ATPase subunit
MSALSVRGLTIAHGKRLVLEDVSFSAQAGTITAVLGGPGAGKTTLLAGVAGLVKPVRGAVLVGGAEVTRLRPARRGVGFLPPGTDLGAERQLRAALRRVAGRQGAAQADAVMAALGLAEAAAQRLEDATHGQGFLALAAARLLPRGPVLLVDEAGTGLSDRAGEAMLDWLRGEAADGRTVVVATRDLAVALAADHLVLLRGGHVVQAGAPASVYAEPRDAEAALMTGPANLLRGTLRQKLPGGFVWMAEGMRFTQQDAAGQASPALGTGLTLCLRLEQIRVGAAPEAANRLEGVVTRLINRGGRTEIACDTALGPMRSLMDGPPSLRTGMAVVLGWDAHDAVILPG